MTGRYPYERQSNQDLVGPDLLVSSCQCQFYCSKWPRWPPGLKVHPKLPKPVPNPLWSLPPRLNPLSMTKHLPIEHFWTMGDPTWGVPWAIFSHFASFCPPQPHFGLMWPKTMVWLYLGLRGIMCNSESTSPRCKPPLFVVPTPVNGLNAPHGPQFWPLAVPVAPLWVVRLVVEQNRDLAVIVAQIAILRALLPGVTPQFLWFGTQGAYSPAGHSWQVCPGPQCP